ncbi:MAG: DUF2480 family protein [Bacteroidota bacterium]
MEIVNKVASSSLLTIDLEEWYPENISTIDIKDYLFQGLILKEKDFREALKLVDWKQFENKNVAVFCSADAIVPTWAFMLISINLAPFAKKITFGSEQKLIEEIYSDKIDALKLDDYTEKRIVIKGCSKKSVPTLAYVKLAATLQHIAKSIMYGEPCSTVPLFKK